MNDELLNILRKVLTLYRKFGIRSVTMDDISHELGISKKTLYQYVRDKDELVTSGGGYGNCGASGKDDDNLPGWQECHRTVA